MEVRRGLAVGLVLRADDIAGTREEPVTLTQGVSLFSLVCVCVCVFITAVPITKLFAWGDGIVEDMCYERRRAEALVD